MPSVVDQSLPKHIQQILAFAFGVVFLVVLLVVTLVFPDLDGLASLVVRVILALAAAGITAILLGFLEVDLPIGVRAGGALAVFVIIYLLNPPALLVAMLNSAPADEAAAMAARILFAAR